MVESVDINQYELICKLRMKDSLYFMIIFR